LSLLIFRLAKRLLDFPQFRNCCWNWVLASSAGERRSITSYMREKADNREDGVGAEAQILTLELYNKVISARVIPIARESNDEGKAYMPVFLKNRYYIDSRDQTRYATISGL
jgi:hypothetical protein